MGPTRSGAGPRLSYAVVHGDMVLLTWRIADRTRGRAVTKRMRKILGAIDHALAEAEPEKTLSLSAQIHLVRIKTDGGMDAEWDGWLPEGHTPARDRRISPSLFRSGEDGRLHGRAERLSLRPSEEKHA